MAERKWQISEYKIVLGWFKPSEEAPDYTHKVLGYSDGCVGIDEREPGTWVVSHLKTGWALAECATRKSAMMVGAYFSRVYGNEMDAIRITKDRRFLRYKGVAAAVKNDKKLWVLLQEHGKQMPIGFRILPTREIVS